MPITRRDFLRSGISLAALGMVAPSFLVKAAYAANSTDALANNAQSGNILVVVQLAGGNDGLNTVVPYTDSQYYRVRPNLALTRDNSLPLTDSMALNPALKNMHALYREGHVAVLEGVGYPNPNRSHFRAMEIWQTARPDVNEPTGWLGRLLTAEDCEDRACRLRGLNVGTSLPRTLYTESTIVPSITNLQNYQFHTDGRLSRDRQAQVDAIHEICGAGLGDGLDEYVRLAAQEALDSSDLLQGIVGRYEEQVTYGNNPFAEGLKLMAQVIRADLGTRVLYITYGGFDTHSQQARSHTSLLQGLDEGIASFYRDLEKAGLAEKVAIMTFSEFGRRVGENASGGTDHGSALPMFLIGGKVRGGFYGDPPDLVNLIDGDIAHQLDFRGVYSSVLKNWLGLDPAGVIEGSWPLIDLFQS